MGAMKERNAKRLASVRARLLGRLETLETLYASRSLEQNIRERRERVRLRGMIASIEMRLAQNDYDDHGRKKLEPVHQGVVDLIQRARRAMIDTPKDHKVMEDASEKGGDGHERN